MNNIEIPLKRILLHISYDGTCFHGSALQGDERTVEKVINEGISALTKEVTEIISASRTDAGVHAKDNIAVFDTKSTIPANRFAAALNPYLPQDVKIVKSHEVPNDFHPRKISTAKTYSYHIYESDFPDPLKDRFGIHCSYKLDTDAMEKAALNIRGEHDFTSFCAAASYSISKVRTVYECRVERKDKDIIILIKGSGFLYNMVRIIAGTLMEVGRGRFQPEDIKDIIDKKDRKLAGPTAPARGLILEKYEFL